MKFKFKIQRYQTDAVENTVAVFRGQPSHRMAECRKLFNSISTTHVKYHKVATYQDLIDGMNAVG